MRRRREEAGKCTWKVDERILDRKWVQERGMGKAKVILLAKPRQLLQ